MERHDHDPVDPQRPDHAAQPEQRDEGFAEGLQREPRTPEERHVGDFAEGEKLETPAEQRVGRFSDGVEMTPETPEKNLEGSFASGEEASPEDRYAEATEQAAAREAADAEIAANLREQRGAVDEAGTVREEPAGPDHPV